MKKYIFTLMSALTIFSMILVSCEPEVIVPEEGNTEFEEEEVDQNVSELIGVYDLVMEYDSVTADDGTWFDNDFYERVTGKTNPDQYGYLTIAEGENGKLNVTATFVSSDTNEERLFFSTTATETDGVLVLDPCSSNYYQASMGEDIYFTFHAFANNMLQLYFKSIYTIHLGYDYSYLTSYHCTKRVAQD